MKVVHLGHAIDGGAGIALQRYHEALLGINVDSKILVMHQGEDLGERVGLISRRYPNVRRLIMNRFRIALNDELRFRLKIEGLDHSANPKPSYEVFTLPFSDYYPEDHSWIAEADVINIHWIAGGLDWPRFFGKVRKPVILTLHDQYPYLGGFHYEDDARNNPHLVPVERALREIKRQSIRERKIGIIANSKWNEEATLKSGFFPKNITIRTIYVPLNTDIYRPRPIEAAKVAFGLDPNQKVIGFACVDLNNKRKGLADLIGSLGLLPEEFRSKVSLLSFGRNPSNELREKISIPWTHLGQLNSDTAKCAAYAAMDIFVAPSRAEAFGQTAMEALAVGVPVVASPVGGLVEAVGGAPRDSTYSNHEMLHEIVDLLNSQSLRIERAKAGRKLVCSRHLPSKIGHELKEFYTRMIAT